MTSELYRVFSTTLKHLFSKIQRITEEKHYHSKGELRCVHVTERVCINLGHVFAKQQIKHQKRWIEGVMPLWRN
ncbi:TPA: hypothetical protein ACTZ5W_005388 [Bacillus cereus]